MAILKHVPLPDGKPFCLCFPPICWTVGVGTVWKCDACGRVFELVGRGNETKPDGGWVRRKEMER